MADLLYKADTTNDEVLKLRNHFVNNYATSLLDHSDTWKIGLRYLQTIPIDEEIQTKIEDTLLDAFIEDNESAERLYAVPKDLHLTNSNSLRKQIATKTGLKLYKFVLQSSKSHRNTF